MDKLTEALTNEVGPPRLRSMLPTSSELHCVSTYVWSEWNAMGEQIKNIPWWNIHLRSRARKKIRQFGIALDVLHHYVPVREK